MFFCSLLSELWKGSRLFSASFCLPFHHMKHFSRHHFISSSPSHLTTISTTRSKPLRQQLSLLMAQKKGLLASSTEAHKKLFRPNPISSALKDENMAVIEIFQEILRSSRSSVSVDRNIFMLTILFVPLSFSSLFSSINWLSFQTFAGFYGWDAAICFWEEINIKKHFRGFFNYFKNSRKRIIEKIFS